MPRNQTQGTTLRNRNRVTNKTRLKIVRGNIDADPLIIDEEEERARIIATSGVDAEDANEHHLQVAINAAAQRHADAAHDIKPKGSQVGKDKSGAYIPTPDATGIVADYETFYTPGQWHPPATVLKYSDTVEDIVTYAVSNGYSYFMDERDSDWLSKNNQEARGEGTSFQVTPGTLTRASRSAKAKGKEPETYPAVAMSEDEFELIMAVFEKDTDERFPFLHVDPSHLAQFSEYEVMFAAPLPPATFAAFEVPNFVENPQRVTAIARAVYPHWRDRRVECGGRRVMPQLNADESNENDPYVCFRRRDSKPIRKTRTSQTAITERMVRLQGELTQTLSLALKVIEREDIKQSQMQMAKGVWNARSRLLELKRRHSSLSGRDDDEILLDKERVIKKPRVTEMPKWSATPKAQPQGSPPPPAEPRMWPKDRFQKIQSEVSEEVNRLREKTSLWEDVVDLSYQPAYTPPSERLYSEVLSLQEIRRSQAPRERFRLRYGRGGRLHVDRCHNRSRFQAIANSTICKSDDDDRMEERWRYDTDSAVFRSSELDDRFIVDDFDSKYLRTTITLLTDEDRAMLSTDNPQLAESNRSIPRAFFQQRRPQDLTPLSLIAANAQFSPPPPTVPSSVPSSIPGSSNGPFPARISIPRPALNGPLGTHVNGPSQQQQRLAMFPGNEMNQGPNIQGAGAAAEHLTHTDGMGQIFRPPSVAGISPMSVRPTQSDIPTYTSLPISKHIHKQHAYDAIQPQQHQMAIGNGLPTTLPNQDLTAQQRLQLKLALNKPQLPNGQSMSPPHLPTISPSPRPSSHNLPMLPANGYTSTDGFGQVPGFQAANLRLPAARKGNLEISSPQHQNMEIITNGGTLSNGGSPISSHSRSPMMRAASVSGNHLTSAIRPNSSPLGGGYASSGQGRISPHPHGLNAAHSPQGGFSPSPVGRHTVSPRPQSSLSSTSFVPQPIGGVIQSGF